MGEIMEKVKKAVILAAGFGTRFMPYCKAVPKCMMPILDTPTIEVMCNECLHAGIKDILIVVGANEEVVKNHFKKNIQLEQRLADKPEILEQVRRSERYNVSFVTQTEINGTAGATMLAKNFVGDEPFLLVFADDVMRAPNKNVSEQVIDAYNKTGKSVLAVNAVTMDEIVRYSSVEFSGHDGNVYDVTRIVEKPKREDVKSLFSTLGRYVLTNEIFDKIDKITNVRNGEKYLTDAFDMLAKENRLVACDFEGKHYDTGNKFAYLKTIVEFGLNDAEYGKDFREYLDNLIKK